MQLPRYQHIYISLSVRLNPTISRNLIIRSWIMCAGVTGEPWSARWQTVDESDKSREVDTETVQLNTLGNALW